LRKILLHVIIVFSFSILIIGCNLTNNESTDNSLLSNGYIFTKNNHLTNDQVTKLINLSSIREKGYVVIISTSIYKKNRKVNALKQQFYYYDIMAVHVLNKDIKTGLKKSDIIMLEKAKIICFVGNGSKSFFNWAVKFRLRKYLLNAKKNGALIAGRKEVISRLKLQ